MYSIRFFSTVPSDFFADVSGLDAAAAAAAAAYLRPDGGAVSDLDAFGDSIDAVDDLAGLAPGFVSSDGDAIDIYKNISNYKKIKNKKTPFKQITRYRASCRFDLSFDGR